MLRDLDEVVRTSTRVATVVVIVGFLVLFLNGSAYPAEPDPKSEAERILLQRQSVTGLERLKEARTVLSRDRKNRVAGMSLAVLDASWRVAMGGSPRSLWKGTRRLYKQGKRWVGHSAAERRALALLEPAVAQGSLDPSVLDLYARLREEETAGLTKHKLDSAERALREGNRGRARRRLELVRKLDPESKRLGVLEQLLADEDELATIPSPHERIVIATRPTADDLRANVALLLGHYDRVIEADAEQDDARLRRAVALHLSGDVDAALETLDELSEARGTTAEISRYWVESSDMNPELGMDRAGRRHALDRTLTWVGGEKLQERGTNASWDGVQAWRRSFTPTNLMIGLPARMWRGDDTCLESMGIAAERYLEVHPDGESAEEAVEWMAMAERDRWNDPRQRAWADGRFVLPPSRTSYAPVLGGPILITRDLLLESEHAELVEMLGDGESLLLAAYPRSLPARGEPLEPGTAIDLVRELARRLDTGEARAFGRRHRAALEALRRLDTSIRSGRTRVRIARWSRQLEDTNRAVATLFADGGERQMAWMAVEREKKGFSARRNLVGRGFACPGRLVCVDKERSWESGAYAELQTDGDMHFGTRASYRGLGVDVGLHEFLPSASVSIPLASWLRIADWVPAGARFGIGADGVSISPVTHDIRTQDQRAEAGAH